MHGKVHKLLDINVKRCYQRISLLSVDVTCNVSSMNTSRHIEMIRIQQLEAEQCEYTFNTE